MLPLKSRSPIQAVAIGIAGSAVIALTGCSEPAAATPQPNTQAQQPEGQDAEVNQPQPPAQSLTALAPTARVSSFFLQPEYKELADATRAAAALMVSPTLSQDQAQVILLVEASFMSNLDPNSRDLYEGGGVGLFRLPIDGILRGDFAGSGINTVEDAYSPAKSSDAVARLFADGQYCNDGDLRNLVLLNGGSPESVAEDSSVFVDRYHELQDQFLIDDTPLQTPVASPECVTTYSFQL